MLYDKEEASADAALEKHEPGRRKLNLDRGIGQLGGFESMSAASESQFHSGNGQLALDVVTATSNEFISPMIRSPRNHSQKPFDTSRLFGASQ